jgi:hypothetical protein
MTDDSKLSPQVLETLLQITTIEDVRIYELFDCWLTYMVTRTTSSRLWTA